MFFSQANGFAGNGRSASPGTSDQGVDSDAEAMHQGSSSILTGEKKSKNPVSTGGVNVKEISPMFHQFLDATYQIMYQYPTRFEFNERFLRRLLYHLYSCQYGTFLYNNEKERIVDHKVAERTRSVWDYFLGRRHMWVNDKYDRSDDIRDKGGYAVLYPKGVGHTRWWAESWCRTDEEMNSKLYSSYSGQSGDGSGGVEMLSGGGFTKGVDDGDSTDVDEHETEEELLQEVEETAEEKARGEWAGDGVQDDDPETVRMKQNIAAEGAGSEAGGLAGLVGGLSMAAAGLGSTIGAGLGALGKGSATSPPPVAKGPAEVEMVEK
jgi:hypothetical protein